MDTSEIEYIINEFASLSRPFAFEEFYLSVSPDADRRSLRERLLTDERFVALGKGTSHQHFFVTDRALFRWFIYLTSRLTQASQLRLTAVQLTNRMNCLLLYGRWKEPPVEAIDFGRRFGFVAAAATPGQYVFPLAKLVSYISPWSGSFAISLLEELVDKVHRDTLPFMHPLEYWLEQGLSGFSKREVEVIRRTEKLLADVPERLSHISSGWGITRERVRQLKEKFWNRLEKRPVLREPFIRGLLYEVLQRQGSLVIGDKIPLVRFFAKCTGIPETKLPNTRLIILGASPEDIASVPMESRNVNTIAASLQSASELCISADDLETICEEVEDFHQKRLTKQERVCIALRSIGRPSHYSEVAEQYRRLYPEEPVSDNNVHSILSREQYGVVWVGIKGTFALEEWGYQRPSKALFEAVTEIVSKAYERTQKPVPLTVVIAEIGKYRQLVNRTSLIFALHCNPNVRLISKDSFVPRDPDEPGEDEVSDDQLDAILREFQERDETNKV